MEKNKKKERNWKAIDSKYVRPYLRFNKKEQEILKPLFDKSNEEYLGTFIKKCVLFGSNNYKENEILYNKTLDSNKEIIKHLSKIGNNLNQIAVKLHLNNSFSEAEKKQLFENINDLNKTIYSKL